MIGLFTFSAYIDVRYADSKPLQPNVVTGRVHGLNVHGTVVYLNENENRIQFWSFWGGLASGLVGGLLWRRSDIGEA